MKMEADLNSPWSFAGMECPDPSEFQVPAIPFKFQQHFNELDENVAP